MKVRELVEKLNLKVLSGENGLDRDIDGCYVSDLLSDVMGNAEMGNVWVTLQTHKNVMAIASLKELACVILVKGLTASDDTVEQRCLLSKSKLYHRGGSHHAFVYYSDGIWNLYFQSASGPVRSAAVNQRC